MSSNTRHAGLRARAGARSPQLRFPVAKHARSTCLPARISRANQVVLVFYPADWSPVCGRSDRAVQRQAHAGVSPFRCGVARHFSRRPLVPSGVCA